MKVNILVNANAKAVRTNRIPIPYLKQFLSEQTSLRVTKSIDEIESAVDECWEQDVDLVLLTTGDGGLHRFITDFVRVYSTRKTTEGQNKPLPVFATLLTGTANLITGIFAGHGKPKDAVRRLFETIKSRKSLDELPRIRQKLLQITDDAKARFGFVTGNGLLYNFFLEYYEGARYNILKFLKIATKMALSLFTGTNYLNRFFESARGMISLDEKKNKLERWKLMAVSAVDTKVVFFRAFKVGTLLDMIHVKGGHPSRLAIIRNIPNLLLNRPLKGREMIDRLVRHVQLERDVEFGYMIDGELYKTKSLDISAGPIVEFLSF